MCTSIKHGSLASYPSKQCLDKKLLLKCSASLDKESNLIVCRGRLGTIDGCYVTNNSVVRGVLPDKNEIAKKLILSVHVDLSHLGPVATVATLNDTFWLLRANQYTHNVLQKSLNCQFIKANCSSPPMSVLPEIRRNTRSFPFRDVHRY